MFYPKGTSTRVPKPCASMHVSCGFHACLVYIYARFDYIRFLESRNSINGNDKIQLQRTFTSFKIEFFEVISTT